MATITKKTCDRCGKEIKYIGWTYRLENVFKKGSKISILMLFNGKASGYSYSRMSYELCEECTKKLRDFLNRKEQK